MVTITIILPCYNEEKYILPCLESLVKLNTNIEDMEVLVIDGMSTDKTRNIVQDFAKDFPMVKLLDNPSKTVPYAMNIGIKNSKSDVIIRLDAHAYFPKNYIKDLIYWLEKLSADNVGGVVETLAGNDTLKAKAIALAMSSSFGVGNSYFRVGASSPMEVDTVPFGCYKKEIFDKIGLYDEDLTRNQDDELNARLIQNGGKIYLVPDIKIKYFARENFKKMAKMFFQYGYFKPLVNLKLKTPSTIRQFIPLLFTLFIIIGGIISYFNSMALFGYIFGITIYLVSNFIASMQSIKNNNLKLLPLLMLSFTIIHLSYGWGYIRGIVDFIFLKKHKVKKLGSMSDSR